MRSRSILLIVAILLVAGFAALNWAEIIRSSPVWFGPFVMDAPLGAILLGLLALAIVVFAVAAGTMRTQSLVESRHHYKTLEAQRELADKAEASRFTDLRQHLDTQLSALRERDTVAASEFEKAMAQNQREMRTQLEQINRTIAARLTELEHRLDSRLGSAPAHVVSTHPVSTHATPVQTAPVANAPVVQATPVRHEPTNLTAAELEAREQQARQERARAEQERATAASEQRPTESGWRKWF